jgi:phenylacetic acid degradation operon negative regulatory protein
VLKPKTEEFLYFLIWSAERLTCPTFRNLTDSYESWAYRRGLLREVGALEHSGLLERAPGKTEDRLYRLTEAGRLCALGGRDPATQWARSWDQRWRLVVFDVPRQQNSRRDRLRRFLRAKSFGCLQGSVWISPDPMLAVRKQLEGGTINVNSLSLFQAVPEGGESNAQIVEGAWDFAQINQRYAAHLRILEELPSSELMDTTAAEKLRRWAASERVSWLRAVSKDPLLPEALLPSGYLGRDAWRKRVEVLFQGRQLLRSFTR